MTGQGTHEKPLIAEIDTACSRCFQFQEVLSLEEADENYREKPQKLVKILGKKIEVSRNILILEMEKTVMNKAARQGQCIVPERGTSLG